MPRTRRRAKQLLVNLALQKAFNTEVHNATKANQHENKDVLNGDVQPGYVVSMFLKKNTVFIVEVHLAIQASLQALHLNPKKQIIQINLTW